MKRSLKILMPVMALPLVAITVWSINHQHPHHYIARSIASEAEVKVDAKPDAKTEVKVDNKEDKAQKLQDIIECQKKYITDLKTEMNKKIDDLKKVLSDKNDDVNKKPDERRPEEKDDEGKKEIANTPSNDQMLQVLMHLTSMIQHQQMPQPQSQLAYQPAYSQWDWMAQEHMFFRQQYEKQIFGNVGLGQDYFKNQMNPYSHFENNYTSPSYSGGFYGPYSMGNQSLGFKNMYANNSSFDFNQGMYHNPYQAHQDYKPMPIMGDEFIFQAGSGLVRQPGSKTFQF
ncbi:MAG: hypothetical protein L6Q33_09630 [Bacteriovoracaceae bacterium]|nr:hypothetical protein [Bacteriovoracaceae bacterium]